LGVGALGVDAGHVGEEGELGGVVAGDDPLAVLEDFAEALVGGFVLVELHPPKKSGGILEELVVESVLGGGVGEAIDVLEVWDVAALEGEGVEFFVGEAVGGFEFFEPLVVGFRFLEDGFWSCGVEALAEVGESEDVFELFGGGGRVGIVEVASSAGGGGGDVEIGLEADAELDGVEGSAEAGLAEPAAEDGW